MVSPRGRGIKKGAHSRTTLGGSSGDQGGGGNWSCRSNSGGGRRGGRRRDDGSCSGRRRGSGGKGGTAHPRPESMTTAGLHHGWARGGEEDFQTGNGDLK